jgi:beta-lactamase class A
LNYSSYAPRQSCAYDSPTYQQDLSNALEQYLFSVGLGPLVLNGSLGVLFVHLKDGDEPLFGGVNIHQMRYSASIPKIAILYSFLRSVSEGALQYSEVSRKEAEAMIRFSSNSTATRLFHSVGPEKIERHLNGPPFYFYTQDRGGLWVGKEYGKGIAYKRDPLFNISHGASAFQLARMYLALDQGCLLPPSLNTEMIRIMGETAVPNKFASGLNECCPGAQMIRKSGRWGNFHGDSALIEFAGERFILIALLEHSEGSKILERLVFPSVLLSQWFSLYRDDFLRE